MDRKEEIAISSNSQYLLLDMRPWEPDATAPAAISAERRQSQGKRTSPTPAPYRVEPQF